MPDVPTEHRFYADLAVWWPLISPPEEYEDEAAVDYMTSEADLRHAIETAFVHCRPGGIAVLIPDHTAETFEAASDHGGNDDPTGRGVRYLEWTWPDPADTWTAGFEPHAVTEQTDEDRTPRELFVGRRPSG
jgi:hypothetical protein